MGLIESIKLTAASGVFALCAVGASAATLEFTDWVSTNPYQLSPTMTLSDDTAGQIDVTVSIAAPDVGSLVGVFMDVDGSTVTQGDIVDGSFSHIGFGSNTLNLGGGSNMTGGGTTAFDFGLLYDKDDEIGLTQLTFAIDDQGGAIELGDFSRVGLRFQESNNNQGQTGNGESDKLVSTTTVPVGAVPLPAAGWLMLGALGGMVGLRRRKRA